MGLPRMTCMQRTTIGVLLCLGTCVRFDQDRAAAMRRPVSAHLGHQIKDCHSSVLGRGSGDKPTRGPPQQAGCRQAPSLFLVALVIKMPPPAEPWPFPGNPDCICTPTSPLRETYRFATLEHSSPFPPWLDGSFLVRQWTRPVQNHMVRAHCVCYAYPSPVLPGSAPQTRLLPILLLSWPF